LLKCFKSDLVDLITLGNVSTAYSENAKIKIKCAILIVVKFC
jgi:hypothetical protein